jgi:4-amino-4-deoxy-L-arabinose transferase-like glycosyltransferase
LPSISLKKGFAIMQKYFLHPYTWIIFLTISAFFGLNEPLWDQDEAAYYGFSTEMIQNDNWIVPDYPLSEPHRKTPLHFWSSAIAMKAFGSSHFIFRLPNTLYFLLCGLLVYGLAFNLSSQHRKEISVTSTIIFLSSIFLMIYQRIALTDIGLLFYSLLGLLSFWKVVDFANHKAFENTNSKKNNKSFLNFKSIWILLFWFAVGMGVLQKGPPILILLGGVFGLFLLFSQNRKLLIQFHPWIFLPLSLLPLFIWGRLAWIATDGVLIRWMIDWYILKRTTSSVFGQSGPPGYYLFLFLLFLFPWSAGIFKVSTLIKEKIIEMIKGKREDKTIFLFSWIFCGWIFYEILPSKLPSYSLSVYPLLCILIAQTWLEPTTNQKTNNQKEIAVSFKWKVLNGLQKYFILSIGIFWIGLLGYMILPGKGIFSSPSQMIFQILGFIPILISIAFVFFQINQYFNQSNQAKMDSERKINSNAIFNKISIGMVSFHFFFAVLYYPFLSEQRNYSFKLTNLLLEMELNTHNKSDLSSNRNIYEASNRTWNGNNLSFHPEIRLPSIVTSLGEKGISTKQISIIKSPEAILNDTYKHYGIILTPKSFLDVLEFIGKKTISKCLDFYSYESGKNLNLCWIQISSSKQAK